MQADMIFNNNETHSSICQRWSSVTLTHMKTLDKLQNTLNYKSLTTITTSHNNYRLKWFLVENLNFKVNKRITMRLQQLLQIFKTSKFGEMCQDGNCWDCVTAVVPGGHKTIFCFLSEGNWKFPSFNGTCREKKEGKKEKVTERGEFVNEVNLGEFCVWLFFNKSLS